VFTGIVREVGRVRSRDGSRLIVSSGIRAESGASVSVNGACLTVVDFGSEELAFDVVPETLARTNLGELRPSDSVNLEPALTLQQPLDGHLVQGHVDATARVLEVRDVELGRELEIELPRMLARYVAEKGSIAVDGTSLTVTGVGADRFGVALIPHTLDHSIAGAYQPGTMVNLEVDVLARYAERLLAQ
jgi:riboflavin synthase